METIAKLFGSLLALVYHCFDRIVILGHLPLLTRPENIVHFFRDVNQIKTISKEILRQRTNDYHRWVEAFAKKRKIPMEWAQKGVRKEDYVRPYLRRMQRRQQFGVYFILKSMELGPSFRSAVPRFPVEDPHYRILARQRSRYTHYYFYIRDEVLGPIALCVGSFLPFSITYYLNGHSFIQHQLERTGVAFRKDDNAFLWAADPQALQAAADRLSPRIIRRQLDHWTWVVGGRNSPPKTAPPSTSVGTTPCNKWSTVATWSSDGTSPSINSSSAPATWDCSASRPTSSRKCSAFASTRECVANSLRCWKRWNTAITCCAPAGKTPCCACTRNFPPSCARCSATT
jgi:hypothetical protein